MVKLGRKAFDGAKPCHPHMLRHTYASLALTKWKPCWDLYRLSKWLGHADVSITARVYAHFIAEEAPSAYRVPKNWYKAGTEEVEWEVTPVQSRRKMVGVAGLEPATSASRTQRASQLRHAPT